ILWKEGLIMGASGIAATQVARPLVYYLEARGWDEIVIPILFIMLLAYFAFTMISQGKREEGGSPLPGLFSSPKLIAVGFVGGLASGVLGVGGGFIIVPLIITTLGFDPRKAIGTSLFAVLLIVSVGFISYAIKTDINYIIGLLLIAGGLIGSQFGARLTAHFKNSEMNAMLGMLYVATLAGAILKLLDLNVMGLVIIGFFILYFFVRCGLKINMEKQRKIG
ncbi:MAG TPA: sulfite exporter TauE/SafE family protein, partial [Bacillus bacterium]|nr:sulfite exporter TauE/SafE family protein [Bacillus sp. (in: firmicutes)]